MFFAEMSPTTQSGFRRNEKVRCKIDHIEITPREAVRNG